MNKKYGNLSIGAMRVIGKLALVLPTSYLLFIFALPPTIIILIWISLFVVTFFAELKNAALVNGSIVTCVLAFEIIFSYFPVSLPYCYRPHECIVDGGKYKSNTVIEMIMPHGDLVAIDANASSEIIETRRVKFVTDSRGNRNSGDYNGQKILIVGDSFVIGTGTTQSDILTEQLRRKHGVDSYNISRTGGTVDDYLIFILDAIPWVREDISVVLVIFEGNDFPIEKTKAKKPARQNSIFEWTVGRIESWRNWIGVQFGNSRLEIFNKTETYRRFSGAIARARKRIMMVVAPGSYPNIIVRDVGKRKIGFFSKYVEVSERATYNGHRTFDSLSSESVLIHLGLKTKIKKIVFVPTKYRVYWPLFSENVKSPDFDCSNIVRPTVDLPHKQWEFLANVAYAIKVPAVDLTGPLRARACSLLDKDRFVFWRDDTHWNGEGIAVAAEEIVSMGDFEEEMQQNMCEAPCVGRHASQRPSGAGVHGPRNKGKALRQGLVKFLVK